MEDVRPSGSEFEISSKVTQNKVKSKPATHNFSKECVNAKRSFISPPSRYTKLKNPFEAHLAERFHTNVFSPSVFKVSSQRVEKNFTWSIDDISCIKPADIDENAPGQCEQHLDSTMESHVQAKIDLFFSQGVVPSPYNHDCKPEPLVKDVGTPVSDVKRIREVSTQTALSLPMNLPPELEKALQPYFNPEELNSTKCSKKEIVDDLLYKRLFDLEECDRSDGETIESSPPKSLSPFAPFPSISLHTDENLENVETFGKNLHECNLSPIRPHVNNIREKRSGTRIDFEERMSLDATTNVVPDVCGDMPNCEYNSFNADTSYESMKEGNGSNISGSTVNWDLEYNQRGMSTPTKNEPNVEMDVSNSNTPKSSFGYRKKLSASFVNEDKSVRNFIGKSYGDNKDTTDLGYQTGATSFYASTPSKTQSYKIT